jgi:putative ABC transport system permease protein
MSQLLLKASLRHLIRHPWQIALAILGVALGVAVVVSIDLANASAGRAFELSTEAITGRTTHQVVAGSGELPEDFYRRLRVELGFREAAPVVEGYAAAPDKPGLTLRILGVDPFAEAPFRSFLGAGEAAGGPGDVNLTGLLTEPGTAVIARETAERHGLGAGDTLNLRVGGARVPIRLVALLDAEDEAGRRALDGLLICDIATAQETLGMVGRLSRVDLIIPPEQEQAALARITAILPEGAQLERPESRSQAISQMTRAFEFNLQAMSLLALIVGMFLIYNTMTFAVVQRRSLLGTMRCMGVTRREILTVVLLEAALVGLVGALVGLALGVVLGRGTVRLVTQTINDLYFAVTVRSLSVERWPLIKGFLLGIGATLAAALVPALEASFTPPRTVLRRSSVEERVRRAVPLAAAGGLALGVVGAVILALPGGGLWGAFGALFCIVIACALLTPAALVLLMALLRPLLGRALGLLGRMAARDVVASLSRTSVAAAALMVAVSVTIGVGIMVGSFRQTVIRWLDTTLQADVYISTPGLGANRVDGTLNPEVVARLRAFPEVVGVNINRSLSVDGPAGPVLMVAQEMDERNRAAFSFEQGSPATVWPAWEQGALLVSEPFSYRTGLGAGDTLSLQTERGPREFAIAGVYTDYTSDRGVILMPMRVYRALWDDQAISSLALFLRPGTDADALIERLRLEVAGLQDLFIRSNVGLRVSTLEVFDRTFTITAVLQGLATAVAFIGILSSLMALQLERARELGVLRANGLTPGQLWGNVLTQTGLMGLAAGLLALPVGLILALVLIFVINRRSFGWTLQLQVAPELLLQALVLALVAALLAGLYPAYRMSRANPALALREE